MISAAISGNRERFSGSAIYGDIRNGPLVPAGVYASHALERLSLSDLRRALMNTYETLSDLRVYSD